MSVVPATTATTLVDPKVAADNYSRLKRAFEAVASQRNPQFKKRNPEGIEIEALLLRVKPATTRSTSRAYHELVVVVGPQNPEKLRALPPYKGRFNESTGVFSAVRQTPGEKGVKRTERQKVPADERDWVYDDIVPGSLMVFKDFSMSVSPANEGSVVTIIDASSSFWSGDVRDEKTGETKRIEILSWLCSGAAPTRALPKSFSIAALRHATLPSCFLGDVTSETFDQQMLVLRVSVGDEIRQATARSRFAVALFTPCREPKDFFGTVGANTTPEMRATFRGAVTQSVGDGTTRSTAFEVSAYKEELQSTFLITDPVLWADVFAWMAHKVPMVLFVKLDAQTSHDSGYTSRAIQHRFVTERKPKIEAITDATPMEAEPEADDADMDGALDNGGVKGTVKVILFDPYSAYKDVLVPASVAYLKKNASKWKSVAAKKEADVNALDINAIEEVFNVSEKPSYFPALAEHVKAERGSFGVMTNATTTTAENVTECAKLTPAEGDDLLDGKTVRGLTLAYQNGSARFCLFFFNDARRKQNNAAHAGLNLDQLAASLESKTGALAGIEHAPVPALPPPKSTTATTAAAAAAPAAPAPAPVAAPDDMDDIFNVGAGPAETKEKETQSSSSSSKKSKKDKK